MARLDRNQLLEALYRTLRDCQFDFVPRGTHHLRTIYRFVRARYGTLCDDNYLCSASCKKGYNSPEWQHVVRSALKNARDRGVTLRRGTEYGFWIFGQAESAPSSPALTVREGRRLLRLHWERERRPGIAEAKKRATLLTTGRLVCEACDFDFASVYGELGSGFAECHHIFPIAEGERETTAGDLAIVCANCHRMLHKRPWRHVEELRALLQARGHFE